MSINALTSANCGLPSLMVRSGDYVSVVGATVRGALLGANAIFIFCSSKSNITLHSTTSVGDSCVVNRGDLVAGCDCGASVSSRACGDVGLIHPGGRANGSSIFVQGSSSAVTH